MTKKRTYGSVDVEKFDVLALLRLLTVGCIVAVDVAKTKFVAAIATAAGEALKLVRFEHPRQMRAFLRVVETLQTAQLEPRVVMEPTGTYGDVLRHHCDKLGVPVHMMTPKSTHDFAEVLDGVPSMHDPKAAVVLARLGALKETRRWQPDSEEKRELRALLDQRSPLSKTHELYHGHLEGMLARHWPEFGTLIDVHETQSWMSLLKRYPGPEAVAANSQEAEKTLRAASRGRLSKERVEAIVGSAGGSLGVPMLPAEQKKMQFFVEQIEQQRRQLGAVDDQIVERVGKNEVMARLATLVGPVCAATLMSYVGSPLDFDSAGAFEKAMGLNLREHSSGEKKGRLSITKRGPGQARQLLYLAALRLLKENQIVFAWYRARGSYRAPSAVKEKVVKVKAVVAVMRKLARALWHVGRGANFDATKLFDVRRLDLTSAAMNSNSPKETIKESPASSVRTSAPKAPRNEGGIRPAMRIAG
jgi:transposase